jgi:hypothetical protein
MYRASARAIPLLLGRHLDALADFSSAFALAGEEGLARCKQPVYRAHNALDNAGVIAGCRFDLRHVESRAPMPLL